MVRSHRHFGMRASGSSRTGSISLVSMNEGNPDGRWIEAVEGCGIAYWAVVNNWDVMATSEYAVPSDVEGYLADQVVQIALFGQVVYH